MWRNGSFGLVHHWSANVCSFNTHFLLLFFFSVYVTSLYSHINYIYVRSENYWRRVCSTTSIWTEWMQSDASSHKHVTFMFMNEEKSSATVSKMWNNTKIKQPIREELIKKLRLCVVSSHASCSCTKLVGLSLPFCFSALSVCVRGACASVFLQADVYNF